MPVRPLSVDDEIVPLEQPKPQGRPNKAVRPLASSDAFVPLGQTQPNVLPAHEPSLVESLFGRDDVGGNAQVEGIVPSIGRDVATTGKEIGNLFMRGGAKVGGLLQQLDVATQAPPGDVRDRALAEVREGNRSAEEFWSPKETTPAGDVIGGLAEAALPIMLGGGSPIPLAASETMHTAEELSDQGIDLDTARAVAVIRGMANYVGAKLPILGRSAPSRVITGGVGNTVLNTGAQVAEKGALESGAPKLTPEEQAAAGEAFESDQPPSAEGRAALAKIGARDKYTKLADQISPLDPKQKAIDFLIGAAFGGLHHAQQAPVDAARAQYERDLERSQILDMVDKGGGAAMRPPPVEPGPRSPRDAANDFYEGFTQEDRETPRLESPEAIAARQAEPARRAAEEIRTAANEPPQPKLEEPGAITRSGRPEDRAPVEQEIELERMGLTPDIIGNLIAKEAEAENARASRQLPAPTEPAPTPPGSQAREVMQERFGREAQQERTDKIAAERRNDLGLTPDIAANLERMKARGAVGAAVPSLGEELAQKAGQEPPAQAENQRTIGAAGASVEPPVPFTKTGKLPQPVYRSVAKKLREVAGSGDREAFDLITRVNGFPKADAETLWQEHGPERPTHGEAAAAPKAVRPLKQGEEIVPLEQGKSAKSAKPKSALEFLAHHGGVSIEALEAEGIDRADMQSVRGFKRPFTKKGMSLDAAAEKLHEAGYDVGDEAGRPSANRALELIDAETRHGKRSLPRGAQEPAGETAPERRTGIESRAGGERRAPPPRETPDRRGDVGERRKPVAEMSLEEARNELLTSHLTGLPNRRAYDERPRQPHQGSIDVDSLKWVNDNMGHGSGDELLKAVGQALKEAAGDRAYHFSGDEFAIEGASADELHALMEDVNERLAKATIEVTKADGTVITLDGLGVSYGLGDTLNAADENLSVAKQTREAQGVRAPRGEKPVGATVRGGGDEGGSDHEGNAPAGEVGEPRDGYAGAEHGSEPAEHEPGDVEHVTLTGEGHVSHTTRGEGDHVTVGEGVTTEEGRARDEKDLADALQAAHNRGTDENYSRVRRLMMRFEMTHGADKLNALIERLDKELEITDPIPDKDEDLFPQVGKRPQRMAPAQGSLFGKEDARPQANEKQIREANKLLAELEDASKSDEEGDIKSLAVSFNREFHGDHTASLVGKTIKSTEDLATLSEIYRNPRFETLRYFITDKSGKIIAQTGVSSRLPGAGAAYPTGESVEWVRKFLDKYPGGRLWMQHNHPSGLAVPSTTDIALTVNFAKTLDTTIHHIVIDHDHYGRMIVGPKGDIASNERIELPHKIGTKDVVHTPSKPHAVLGRSIIGPKTLVEIAKELERKEGYLTVIGVAGGRSAVKTIGDMPAHLMNNPERLKQQLRRFGVMNGAGRLFIAGVDPAMFRSSEARRMLNDLQYDNYITDVVDRDGHSFSGESGGIITQSGRDYGVHPHHVAREVKPREPGIELEQQKAAEGKPPKRTEDQADMFDVGAGAKNKLAATERAKDSKRSPNKDVPADLGIPGDLFTKHRQGDLIKDVVPHVKLLQKRADRLVDKIAARIDAGETDAVNADLKRLRDTHQEIADAQYGERLQKLHSRMLEHENAHNDERAARLYDRLFETGEKYIKAGGSRDALIKHAPALANDAHLLHADELWQHEPGDIGEEKGEIAKRAADEFIRREKTGDIRSDAYDRHNKDLSWLGTKKEYGQLVKKFTGKDGTEYEMRKTGEPLKYTKLDENDEIVRGPDGMALMQTPEEIAAKGYPTHDQTLAAFKGDKVVGFASDEFGAVGVFVQEGHQRNGIGTELLAQFRKENPKQKLGQMTPQGEALARKLHELGLIREGGAKYDTVGESGGIYHERRKGADRREPERGGGRRDRDQPESQKGDKGYAGVAQKAIDAWNKKVGWRYGPLGRLPAKKQYLEQRYAALGKLGEGQEIARKLYDGLRQATPKDSAAIYEYLTNKDGDLSTIDDPAMRQIAATTKRTIDLIGQRLVRAGLLSQEAYDAHAGEYLPRLYLKYMLGDDVMRAIGSGKRMSDLGYLKQRKDIDEYTRKVILGEITDPAFLASFGISRTLRDLALHDFLRAIAGREQWTPRHSTVEWRGRQVTPFYLADEARALRRRAELYKDPKEKAEAIRLADEAQKIADEGLQKLEARPDPNDFEQIPNSRRYGALRGMYVRKEIYGDLVGAQQWIPANSSVAEQLLGSGGIAARAQSWWKMSKVILNPPTQVRNFVANMVLLHLSGVPFHRVYSGEIIGKAINSIANKDRYYQIAKKYGLFSATFANTEGARIKEEWLALQDMKGGGLAKLRAFAGRGVNAASDFYQLMEAISKIAKIRDAIEREGKKPADAVLEAHEALFDYSLVPRSVQYLRNAPVGAPFITFAYKAAAQMAKIAIKHPARFAPYLAIPFLMAELIKHSYDVNDDDLKKLRNALPAWMKERGHMMLLPYKDSQGRWQVVDLGYLVPWGQFADLEAAAEQGKGAKELAGSLAFSGPMMDVANAIQTGTDPFTGREIVNSKDPPGDRLQQMMQYVWNLAAPGWLTEQGALNQLRKSVNGTNLNKRTGEPGMTPTQASLRLLGLNIYPADPSATRAANLRAMRANLEDSRARASELLRNKNLSDEERNRIRDVWSKLLEARAKEIELYSRESEINPKLQ